MSIEIERKYVIMMPDFEVLKSQKGYSASEILQIYLKSETGITHRVRRRLFFERVEYTETKKIRLDKMSAIEDECEISPERFDELIKNVKEGTRPILKVRHVFDFDGFCFELDVYPEWKHTCIMEVELESADVNFEIPPFIKVVEEVTGRKEYSNFSMSRNFPPEKNV